MRVKPSTFPVELAAGRTLMNSRGHVIYRPNGMDGWILNYTAEGVGRINRDQQQFTTQVGEFLLFRPLAIHDYGMDLDHHHWVHLWVYFFPRAPWYDWLTWSEVSSGVLHLDLRGHPLLPKAVRIFEEICAVARGPQPRRVALAMSLLEQLLLWLDAANPASGHTRLDPRIQLAVAHCHEHFTQRHSIEDLAALANLSPSRFTHLFSAQMGASPLQYLDNLRINAAREQLLLSGSSITDIADAVGYSDTVWFARCFRRRVGVSPRAYRQRALRGGSLDP